MLEPELMKKLKLRGLFTCTGLQLMLQARTLAVTLIEALQTHSTLLRLYLSPSPESIGCNVQSCDKLLLDW